MGGIKEELERARYLKSIYNDAVDRRRSAK